MYYASTSVVPRRDANVASRGVLGDETDAGGRNLIAVVGIDRYQDQPCLRNAVRDASATANLFLELGFRHAVPPLVNDDATADALWVLVTHELTMIGPLDSLVVFYAGHGASKSHRLGAETYRTGYLLPVDASDAVHTWIELESWLRAIALLPARHILVILDACYSGIALDPIIKWRSSSSRCAESLLALQRRRSRKIITSAMADQIALDSGLEHGNSLFTSCLLEAFKHGLRRGGRSFATGSEVALYVQQRVLSHPNSQQTQDFGSFALDARGEMIIPLIGSTLKIDSDMQHDEWSSDCQMTTALTTTDTSGFSRLEHLCIDDNITETEKAVDSESVESISSQDQESDVGDSLYIGPCVHATVGGVDMSTASGSPYLSFAAQYSSAENSIVAVDGNNDAGHGSRYVTLGQHRRPR